MGDSKKALSRRFQKVEVPEPSVAETVEILNGLRPRFEAHHGGAVYRVRPADIEDRKSVV